MQHYTHDHYRRVLLTILCAGYDFIDFPTLSKSRAMGRHLVMRHDCDNDLIAAQDMSEIEVGYGVRATYFLMLRSALYNLLSPPNLTIARQLVATGHHIGLHFDMYACEHLPDADVCRRIRQELDILGNELGILVPVVSFHQPSARILENRLAMPVLNTYSRDDMQGAFYASDSNMRFRYGEMEEWFASAPHPTIQFLIHPEWWTVEELPLADKWRRMLSHNAGLMVESLRTRENAYAE